MFALVLAFMVMFYNQDDGCTTDYECMVQHCAELDCDGGPES